MLFTKDEDFLAFERVVEESLRTRRMRLCAYCLMSNHWHFVVWPERDGDLPAFMQQVTNTHVKRWKEHRHEIGYGHLYQGRYKCFPVETEDYFYQVVRYVERNALRANLVERAESMALVEFATCRARRPGVSDPLDVAFAASGRLDTNCQPTANGSRTGGVALLRQSRSALWRSQLGHRHGQTIGAGMDASAPWKTEETSIGLRNSLYYPDLVAVTFLFAAMLLLMAAHAAGHPASGIVVDAKGECVLRPYRPGRVQDRRARQADVHPQRQVAGTFWLWTRTEVSFDGRHPAVQEDHASGRQTDTAVRQRRRTARREP